MRRRWSSVLSEHPVAQVNLTPMIDVIMVLIVFYLLVGHLVLERRGEVSLPVSAAGQAVPEHADPSIISIERDGTIRLDGRAIKVDALADALALNTHRRVRLRADRTLPFDTVRPVLAACRQAGIESIELATEQTP
jgi:biopolymer transport protein ExbD